MSDEISILANEGRGAGGGILSAVALLFAKAYWDKRKSPKEEADADKRDEHVAKSLDDLKESIRELKTTLAVLVERGDGRWTALEAEVRALRADIEREREAKHELASKVTALNLTVETRLARLEGHADRAGHE